MPKVQTKATTQSSRGRNAISQVPYPKYVCSICEKPFPRQIDVDRHERIHSEDVEVRRPYKCSKCDSRFTNKDALKPHMESKHSSKAKYPCRQCGKPCKTKSGQLHHEKKNCKERGIAVPQKVYTFKLSEMSESPSYSDVGSPVASDQSLEEFCHSFDLSTERLKSEPCHEMPANLIIVAETSFASRLSPTSEYSTGSSEEELVNGSPMSTVPAPVLFLDSQEGFDLSSGTPGTYAPPVYPDFAYNYAPIAPGYVPCFSTELVQGYTYANLSMNNGFNQSPFDFSQIAGSNFGVEPNTYSLNDQSYLPPQLSTTSSIHEVDASWEAWIAQGGEPSLMAYFLSSFPFNDDANNMGQLYNHTS